MHSLPPVFSSTPCPPFHTRNSLPRPALPCPAGQWTCERGCFCAAPNYRYIASCTLLDWSGQEFATLFDGEGKAVLGIDANALQAMVVDGGGDGAGLPPRAEAHFRDAAFKEYLMTTKARMEDRNGEQRVKVTVVKVREVEPARESKALIGSLKQYVAASGSA